MSHLVTLLRKFESGIRLASVTWCVARGNMACRRVVQLVSQIERCSILCDNLHGNVVNNECGQKKTIENYCNEFNINYP